MAGVWDALGRGIESGVSAFLQGQEQQLRRKREEEEKAQREKEWLLTKMRGEAGLSMAERQFGFEQEQAKEAAAARERAIQESIASQGRELAGQKELARLRASLEKGAKEPTPDLYDPNFNPKVATALAMAFLDTTSGSYLQQYISGQQGQANAANIIASLVATHGKDHPDLETNLWNLFDRIAQGKIQTPTEQIASEAARAQARAQQGAVRTAQQAEQARLAPIAAVQTQQAAQRGLAAGGVPVPIAAGMPAALQANVQPFTQDELAKLQMYDEAPEMTKPMMKNVEPFRSLLMRRGR